MSSDFATTIRKIEDLPSDHGHIVDVLSGGLLRLFAAVARLEKRLAALEQRAWPAPSDREEGVAVRRGRSRPPGSRNKPKPPNEVDTRPAI